jgi:hypothetical protein
MVDRALGHDNGVVHAGDDITVIEIQEIGT